MCDIAARQLTDDERVREHLVALEGVDKALVYPMQMIDPDRRIDENHALRWRRPAFAFRSDPPSRASRLALCRAINARRPS